MLSAASRKKRRSCQVTLIWPSRSRTGTIKTIGARQMPGMKYPIPATMCRIWTALGAPFTPSHSCDDFPNLIQAWREDYQKWIGPPTVLWAIPSRQRILAKFGSSQGQQSIRPGNWLVHSAYSIGIDDAFTGPLTSKGMTAGKLGHSGFSAHTPTTKRRTQLPMSFLKSLSYRAAIPELTQA
jgi:hypothetical protein